VDIPNCRYITFDGGYAYGSSYAGAVYGGEHNGVGYIVKIDTATLQQVATCTVGYQPDGLAVAGGKIYVANSGGYQASPDSAVSVIDISAFAETGRITVGINPDRVATDGNGAVWVSTRGNYMDVAPNLYRIKPDGSVQKFDIPVSEFCIAGDLLYYYGTEYDADWNTITTYGILNTTTGVPSNLSLSAAIGTPYGIAVNPVTKDIYVTDARDYSSPGTVFCFDNNGTLKWRQTAGYLPAAVAFR
jgi:DNA-binding beta-propeller fold protein YncE